VFEELSFDRFTDWEADEPKVRAVVTNRLTKGRKVARHPAIIPAPGSIVDQIAILVAFPSIHNQLWNYVYGQVIYSRSRQFV
jgi:hypothetical protein